MILETIVVTPFSANSYILGCSKTKHAAVIDPGGDIERILKNIERLGLTVTHIVSTHAHIDHAAGAAGLKQATGAAFCLHPDEIPLLQQLNEHGSIFDLPISGIPEVDHPLRQGDSLAVGDLKLNVIETPGHSPCGICLLRKNMLFVGDTIFDGSIGRTDLFGGDYQTLLRSIRDRILTLPDDVTIYPGHGPATTVGKERQTNLFCRLM
ncbi:MAG: hypothetical protein B6244_05645 [Candidatus Cloacimonetes bacterium 4572_55]|nr:MAG: hypothetical protein B6244_05645 [Candidatus Cloacimonetes bacterium 4572_55]